MKNLAELSISELAAFISESLRKEGLDAILSGGACAEIYSNSKYVTGDLDFVVNYFWPGNDAIIDKVMGSLGFKRKGRIFVNPSIAYSVEFPPGPISIGEERHVKPSMLKMKTGNLSLLSPTDSVKDRLTGYFYGNDAQCLEQAVMIYEMNDVKLEDIEKRARKEGCDEKYMKFENRVKEESALSKSHMVLR